MAQWLPVKELTKGKEAREKERRRKVYRSKVYCVMKHEAVDLKRKRINSLDPSFISVSRVSTTGKE